jgi:hypothetical protein
MSYDVIIPAQGEFGSDIPAGDGKLGNLFLRCIEDRSWSPSCPTLAREKKREREFDLIELLLEAAKGRLYRFAWQEVAYLY